MNENIKSLCKTIGWSTAIILGIILLLVSATICTNSDSNEENRRAYERGYNWPSAVGRDLVFIDVGARIKCNKMGLDQDGCPQSDGDTTRRVMATLMTQTIEKNGPAWEGYAYVPETIRAMNHRFVDLIRHLEENPCSLIPYGYATDQILEQLREGRFIYRCGQGWGITTEWLEALEESDTNTGSNALNSGPNQVSNESEASAQGRAAETTNTPGTSQPETAESGIVVPVEVSGTPVFMPALTRDASELWRVSEEHSRLLTSAPPTSTLTTEQLRGQINISTTMPTPRPTPKALQGSVYESCEDADAAGEQRIWGVWSNGNEFPKETVPSARDEDGDGIVCEG